MGTHDGPGGAHVGLTPETERTLRRYVLGVLEEGPRSAIEERLVMDPEVFDALGVVEDELIEEYIEESGPAEDRRGFERNFLSRPQGPERLRLARALRQRAASRPPARSRPASAASRPAAPAWWPPALMGLAAGLLASVAGNVWLASRAPRAGAGPPSPAAVSVSPATASAATTLRAEPAAPIETRPNGRPASIPAFVLTAGLLRGEGSLTRVSAPPDAPVVALVISLAGEYTTYRAALTNEDGDAIWSAATLRAEGPPGRRTVRLLVPTSLLPRGDYRLDLDGVREREPERIGSYTFRVTGP